MNRLLTAALALLLAAPALAQDAQPEGPPVPQDIQLYGEASMLMHRQQHEQAFALFGELLKNHPKSSLGTEATFFRAQCLEELGRRDEARAAYQALIKAHAKSGWAHDARRRLAALESFKAAVAARQRADRLAPDASPRTLVLTGGDRLSARIVAADGKAVKVHTPAFGHLTVPRERIAQVYRHGPRTRSVHAVDGLFVPEGDDRDRRILELLIDDDDDDDDRPVGKSTTVVKEDGTKVTTTVHPDGSKTVTTVREDDGRKTVTVERTRKDGDQPKTAKRIELRIDGDDLDLDEDLQGLPKKLRAKIRKQLGNLKREDLDFDFDFDLDGFEGLEGLENLKDLKQLEGLPEKLRLRIRKEIEDGIHGEHGKHKKHVMRLFGDGDEEEDVFILRGEDGKRRVKVLKDRVARVKKRVNGLKNYTWTSKGDRPHVYAFRKDGQNNVWFDGQGGYSMHLGGDPTKDRVHLRNGDKISGSLLRVTESHVEMKTTYGEVKIKRDQVRQIQFKSNKQARTKATRAAPSRARFLGSARPHLGIFIDGEADGPGVKVSGVQKGTCAEACGLKKGDVIRQLDDASIASLADLRKALSKRKVGQTVTLHVKRGDDRVKVSGKLGTAPGATLRRPPTPPAPPKAPRAPRRMRAIPTPPAPPAPPAPRKRSREY